MNTGHWIRSASLAAGVTLLSALVVAFAGLFALDIVPLVGGEGSGSVPDGSHLSRGVFLAGYLLLAVGSVASAITATMSWTPGSAPTVAGAVVLLGVALVVVGTWAMLDGTLVLSTFGFLSVGIPPALLVVAYNSVTRRHPGREVGAAE